MNETNQQRLYAEFDRRLRRRAFVSALTLFRQASVRVPAYHDFLTRAKIKPELIRTPEDFASVPPTTKENYITQYSLADMSWDGTLDAKYISTSSGSTGEPFFWPRGVVQDKNVEQIFRPVYEKIFQTRDVPTLVIVSFGLGTWIAGFELYNVTKAVADRGNPITLATPSIDKVEILRILRRLGPSYPRIILAGYPPFVKDVLDSAKSESIDLSGVDVRLFTAGEAISEAWRSHMLEQLGQSSSLDHIINYYGMAETGTVAHETPFSVLVRRALESVDGTEAFSAFGGHDTAAIYQYRPTLRYFETGADNNLVLTSPAGMPLLRYNTRDLGGLVDFGQVLRLGGAQLAAQIAEHNLDISQWRLPFVYLYGRRDLSASLYAVNIYPENIKAGLEDKELARDLTGIFVMETKNKRNQDQYLEVHVELAPGHVASASLKKVVTTKLLVALRHNNAEYNKLYGSIDTKVTPKVTLVLHGSLPYQPGRKHKWVKRG